MQSFASSSCPCAQPRCSHCADATLMSSVLNELRCSSSHSWVLVWGRSTGSGSWSFKTASLETAASSQWLLYLGCLEFWPCLLRGHVCVGYPSLDLLACVVFDEEADPHLSTHAAESLLGYFGVCVLRHSRGSSNTVSWQMLSF